MTSKRKPYKTYTKEFKQEAVRMMEQSDKPATEIAMEHGNLQHGLYEKDCFPSFLSFPDSEDLQRGYLFFSPIRFWSGLGIFLRAFAAVLLTSILYVKAQVPFLVQTRELVHRHHAGHTTALR